MALPDVPAGVEIRMADDYGPATKLLPALREVGSDDGVIIYCDDDKIYLPNWAAKLVEAAKTNPSTAFAWAGCSLNEICDRHLYRHSMAALATRLSLGLLQPLKWKRPSQGPIDIAFGYAGVLVRPRFFSPAVFDIPTGCLVDDIWFSGQLRLAGTPVYKLSGPVPIRNRRSAEFEPLKNLKIKDIDRSAADFGMICHFRDRYGIWID